MEYVDTATRVRMFFKAVVEIHILHDSLFLYLKELEDGMNLSNDDKKYDFPLATTASQAGNL